MEKPVLKSENELSSQGDETKVLYTDVCQIINNARVRLATYANAEVCMTNYYVGKRIKEDVLYNKRADYGQKIIRNLAEQLTNDFGKGWGYEKLKQCIRVAECFTEEERGCIKTTGFGAHSSHNVIRNLFINTDLQLFRLKLGYHNKIIKSVCN